MRGQQTPTRQRPTLYLVCVRPLTGGTTVEDRVVASDESESCRKARALYPREHHDLTVYPQSTDDDSL